MVMSVICVKLVLFDSCFYFIVLDGFFSSRTMLLFDLNLQLRNHITLNYSMLDTLFPHFICRISYFFSPSFSWPLITKLDSVNCRNAFLATVFRTEVLRESDDATDIHLFCWDVKIINIVTDTKFIEVLL